MVKYVFEDVKDKIILEYGSMRKFISKNDVSNFFIHFLRYGIVSNSQFKNYKKTFKYFDFTFPSNLEYVYYDKHIEVFGELEDLETFKNKYQIPNNIFRDKYRGNRWHLAFHGFLADYIKYKSPRN